MWFELRLRLRLRLWLWSRLRMLLPTWPDGPPASPSLLPTELPRFANLRLRLCC
jgi:hypothetical protein